MVIGLLWSVTHCLQLSSADLSSAYLWLRVQMLGPTLLPVVWLALTLRYTRRSRWLNPITLALLLVIPASTLFMLFGRVPNPVASDAYMIQLGSYALLHVEGGPWFWVHNAYTYSLILVVFVLLVEKTIRMPSPYRREPVILLSGLLLLMMWNLGYMLFLAEYLPVNPTTLVATIVHVLLACAIFRYRLYDIMPIARVRLIEEMPDGLVVLDDAERIVELNPAARAILDVDLKRAIGRHPSRVLADHPVLQQIIGGDTAPRQEFVLERRGEQRYYEMSCSTIGKPGEALGRLITLRDVTQRKVAELEREKLIADLHAAADHVETLSDLLPVCAWCGKIRDDQGYWQRLDHYLQHRSGTEFTHGICPECTSQLSHQLEHQEREQ
jgi:PAS domain S-box-containing protein